MRIVMLVGGFLIGALVVGALVVDEGEVVTLTTRAPDGSEYETQLWIIERQGELYLRAVSPDSGWLMRLRDQPSVVLERGDQNLDMTAVVIDDAELRQSVNGAMSEKYGVTEGWWRRFVTQSKTVPVRLDPVSRAASSDGVGPLP